MSEEIIGKEFDYLGMRCRVIDWAPRTKGVIIHPRGQSPFVNDEVLKMTICDQDKNIRCSTLKGEFAADARRHFMEQLKKTEKGQK